MNARFAKVMLVRSVLFLLIPAGLVALFVCPLLGRDSEDPIPIRRVLLPSTPGRAETLQRDAIAFELLRRADFEARVRKAAHRLSRVNNEPKLVRASYSASFVEGSLVSGEGVWEISASNPDRTIIRVNKLNLAVTGLKGDTGKVFLFNIGDEDCGLALAKAVHQTVTFQWTLRGKATATETSFDLHLPECVSTTLDLRLPAGYVLTTQQTGLLISKLSRQETDGSAIWQVQTGGHTSVRVAVRRPPFADAEASRVTVHQLATRHELRPGLVVSEHEFTIEFAKADSGELVFECHGGIRPVEVSSRVLELTAWEVKTPTDTDGPTLLRVVVNADKLPGKGQIVIRSLQTSASSAWTSPEIRLPASPPHQETVTILTSPDLAVEAFKSGDFRVVQTSVDKFGAHTIALKQSWPGQKERPGGLVRSAHGEGTAQQNAVWRVGGTGSSLSSQVTLLLNQGKLFQLAFKMPKGVKPWKVEGVEMTPKGLLRSWSVVGPTLLIDLNRPVEPDQPANLKLDLSAPHPPNASVFAFPDIEPPIGLLRHGSLALSSGPEDSLTLLQSSVPPLADAGGSKFVLPYHGQAPSGSVRFHPSPKLYDSRTEPTDTTGDPPKQDTVPKTVRRKPVADGSLTTFVKTGEPIRHVLRLTVADWSERQLSMVLPGSLSVLSATVNGHWVSHVQEMQTANGLRIGIPLVQTNGPAEIEIVFLANSKAHLSRPSCEIQPELPQLPLPLRSFRWSCFLEDEWIPLRSDVRRSGSETQPSGLERAAHKAWSLGTALSVELFRSEKSRSRTTANGASPIEWEVGTGAAFIAINVLYVRTVGICLSVLLLGFAFLTPSKFGLKAYFVCLTLSGLGAIWLPEALQEVSLWPLAALLAIGVARHVCNIYCVTTTSPSVLTKTSKATATLTLAVLGLAFLTPAQPGRCQAAPPHVVYIIGDPLNEEKQSVLVPRELLKLLDAPPSSGETPVAIAGAKYSGKTEGKHVLFIAEFEVVSFADQAELCLPLENVDLLEGSTLDGQPVYPSPHVKRGYAVPIRGKGSHTVRLRFTTPITIEGGASIIGFETPRVPDSRLQLELPEGSETVSLLSGFGAFSGATRVQAGLGNDNTIRLKWQSKDGKHERLAMTAREAYWCEIKPGATLVTARYELSLSSSTEKLSIEVPEGYEVHHYRLKTPAETAAPIVVREHAWSSEGSARRLHLALAEPASGAVELELNLLEVWQPSPKQKGTRLLRLPQVAGAKTIDGVVAVQTHRSPHTIQGQSLALTPISQEAFNKIWDGSAQADHAYSFRRAGPRPALLVNPLPAKKTCDQTVTWNLGPYHSRFHCTMGWTSSSEESLLEVHIPENVVVSSVEAPHLLSWSRTGPVLQAWLSQPRKEESLAIAGWMPNAVRLVAPKQGRFALPQFRVPGAAGNVRATLVPESGLTVEPVSTKQLTKASKTEMTFTTSQPNYEASFQLKALMAETTVSSLVLAETRKGDIVLSAGVECSVPSGPARSIAIALKGWPANTTLQAPPGVLSVPNIDKSGTKTWRVTFPAGFGHHAFLWIHGRRPGSEKEAIPALLIQGADRLGQWVGIAGGDAEVVASNLIEADTGGLPDWMKSYAKLAKKLWSIQATDWTLTVRTASRVAETIPVPLPPDEPAPVPRPAAATDAPGDLAAIVSTIILCSALFLIWMLSRLPKVLERLNSLWPEQILTIAFAGWLLLGPSVLGVLLAIVGVGARLTLLVRQLKPGLPAAHSTAQTSGS